MQWRKINGQGLIEVMMTLLIIAVSILALLRFQNYLAYSNNLTNQKSIAYQLALTEIETLRDYSALTGANSYANIASGSSSQTLAGATFTITWTVTANVNPTYKKIDVNVTWTDQYGGSQSTRLISDVSQTDPSFSSTIMAM